VLRRHRRSDGPQLVAAVNASLVHLAPWMPWAQEAATDASIDAFLADAERDFANGTDFNFAIVERDDTTRDDTTRDDTTRDDTTRAERLIGGCGLHRRLGPGAIEIGYWVHVDHLGRGIARSAAVALRDEAFAMGIERVEIHCNERNTASAAVASSAGFELVGTAHRPARTPGESDRAMIWRTARAGPTSAG
jgi:RimJ/RimL family protein N-acetyltransferase